MNVQWPAGHGDTVKIWEAADGQFYWHVQAGNGEIVEEGEGYTRLTDAINAAERHHPAEGSQR